MIIRHPLVATLIIILNSAQSSSQMDDHSNENPDYDVHNYLLYSKNPLSTPVGHSSSGEHHRPLHQSISKLINDPDHHHEQNQTANLDHNYDLHSTTIGHSSGAHYNKSHTDVQVHETFIVRAPPYNVTALARCFAGYPALDVHVHNPRHFHGQRSSSIVPPFTELDRTGSTIGLRYLHSRLQPGYFRLNEETTEYIPLQPHTKRGFLISVPDMCILGIIDGNSFVYWGLYAILNGRTLERVIIPHDKDIAELMLPEEIFEYQDKRKFQRLRTSRKRKTSDRII